MLIALSLGFMCVFSGSLLLVLATERECARMHMCVIHKMMWYGEGFWGVLVFLLPAGGLLPTSSLINSTPSLARTHKVLLYHYKSAGVVKEQQLRFSKCY